MAARLSAPTVHGRVLVPPECDGERLLPHVLTDLVRRGCVARMDGAGRVAVESGTPGRGSVLSFVGPGTIWLEQRDGEGLLRYEFETKGALLFCAAVSPVAAGLAWFVLGSPELAAFGAVAPVAWLYGANYVLSGIRVPGLLGRLCRTAPGRGGDVPSGFAPGADRPGISGRR